MLAFQVRRRRLDENHQGEGYPCRGNGRGPTYRRAYDALEDEFVLMNELIRAHMRAQLSQAEIASRMGAA